MIITCGNCETSFNLDEKLLKPTGSKVRCSKCKHMFTAYPPPPPEEEPAVEEDVVTEEIKEKPVTSEAEQPEAPVAETTEAEAEAEANKAEQPVEGEKTAQ